MKALELTGFGERLYEARMKAGLSQYDLGRRMGLDSGMVISHYENETRLPGLRSLACLAITLKVSTDWLAGLTDKQELRE